MNRLCTPSCDRLTPVLSFWSSPWPTRRLFLRALMGILLVSSAAALYEDAEGVVVLQDFADFERHVVNGDQRYGIWMLHLYDGASAPTKHAEIFTFLSRMSRGLFSLAAVDVSTDGGSHIADYCRASTGTNQPLPDIVLLGDDKGAAVAYEDGWDIQNMASALISLTVETLQERAVRFGGGEFQAPPQNNKKKPSSSSSNSRRNSQRKKGASAGGTVVEVTESNFDELVLQNRDVVMVAFTAPWCGHCQRLRPEWDEAAQQLGAGAGAVLAWCDATEATNLAVTYQVRGYPTIKIFPGGDNKTARDAVDYNGERTAKAVVQYVLAEVDRSGVPKEIEEMTSEETLEENCSGHNHLCVLAALPHILDSGAQGRNRYRDLLASVAKSFRGSSFTFLWFEGSSQPQLEQALELTFGYPALVALSMDKGAYSVLHGSFTEKGVSTFLHSITTGRQPTVKLASGLPPVVTVTPWDGQDAAPPEEEFSLDDIMGDDDDDTGAGNEEL